MNAKQWTSLLFFYALYLLMGAYVFQHLEVENENSNVQKLLQLQSTLSFVVQQINDTGNKDLLIDAVRNLESHTGKNLFLPQTYKVLIKNHLETTHYHIYNLNHNASLVDNLRYIGSIDENGNDTNSYGYDVKTEDILKKLWNPEFLGNSLFEEEGMWTMWNSFFFSFTALSTIGYGHMSPRTAGGQLFCIFFCLIGVPLNGILFAGLEGLFSSKIIRKIDNKRYESQWMLLYDSVSYMVPGLIVFMLLPAVIFMSVERWSYLESFYFSFITLTTIGFGDMVAGYSDSAGGDYSWLYRIGIQLWVIFGLGYFLMVITFIQKVLSSKEIRVFERKIRSTFKKKATVINDNLLKDLIKMREVVETISILKRKNNVDENVLSKQISTVSLDRRVNRMSVSSVTNSNENIFDTEAADEDQNSLDIFMEIAETILHRSYSRSNSKCNETIKSFSEIGQDNYGYQNEEIASHEPPRKASIFRKISTWSVHAIPALLKTHTHKDERVDNNEATIQSESPDVIDSLGQLIGCVENVIFNEPMTDRNKRERAFSLVAESDASEFFNPTTGLKRDAHRKFSLHSNYSHPRSQGGSSGVHTKI